MEGELWMLLKLDLPKKIQGHLRYCPTSMVANPEANSPPKAPDSGAAQ